MKAFVILFLLLSALSSYGMTRPEAERLLKEKNLSLTTLEAQGWKLLPGEVTGHGRAIAFSKVQAILTEDQAIMRSEFDAVSFSGAEVLSSLESLRFSGQYIMRQDVKASLILDR